MSAAACLANGGTCSSPWPSCCDACADGGCATTTTSTTTTTTTDTIATTTTITTDTTLPGSTTTVPDHLYSVACCQSGTGDSACSTIFPYYLYIAEQSVYCGMAVGTGGVFHGGNIPTGSSPCPGNPQLTAGPCSPPPTIAVTSTLCCQHNGSCNQITTNDPGAYSVWRWSCQYQANPNFTFGSGTCDGPSGTCTFGH